MLVDDAWDAAELGHRRLVVEVKARVDALALEGGAALDFAPDGEELDPVEVRGAIEVLFEPHQLVQLPVDGPGHSKRPGPDNLPLHALALSIERLDHLPGHDDVEGIADQKQEVGLWLQELDDYGLRVSGFDAFDVDQQALARAHDAFGRLAYALQA